MSKTIKQIVEEDDKSWMPLYKFEIELGRKATVEDLAEWLLELKKKRGVESVLRVS